MNEPFETPRPLHGRRPILSFSGGTLLLQGVSRRDIDREFAGGSWRWDSRVSAWRCDAVRYPTIVGEFEQAGCDFEDRVADWHPVRWPRIEIHNLRHEQRAAVAAWNSRRLGWKQAASALSTPRIRVRHVAELARVWDLCGSRPKSGDFGYPKTNV